MVQRILLKEQIPPIQTTPSRRSERVGPEEMRRRRSPRPCNKRVIESIFRGAKSQRKTLQMTISTSKTEKTLKNSMLYELAPQPGLEPGTYGLTEIRVPQKPL